MGDFIRSDSNLNFLGIKDQKIDELVAAHSDHLHNTMPYVPVASHYYNYVHSCRLKNTKLVRPNVNTPMVVEAWLDPAGC